MEGCNQEPDEIEEDCWTGQTSPRTVELAERKYRPGKLSVFINYNVCTNFGNVGIETYYVLTVWVGCVGSPNVSTIAQCHGLMVVFKL